MGKRKFYATLSNDCICILNQAKKLNPIKTISRSQLIEYAIRKTFQNKIEALREQAQEYGKRIMEIQDKIKELEEQKQ